MASECVLSRIKEKFDDPSLEISLRKVPFYISSFLKEERDVIFIYKQIVKPKVLPYSVKSVDNDIFDGDITGQPLEAPHSEYDSLNVTSTFEVYEEETEADFHSPVSLLDARSILSYCSLSLKPELPVWILTDASDLKRTVLLSVEHDGGWITRSWLMDKGYITPPSLEDLLNQHSQFSNSSPHLATCEVKCIYDIQREVVADEPSLLHSSIRLHASWNKMSLEPPLLHRSTEMRVNTQVRIGYERGGLQLLWKQICLLDSYLTLMLKISTDSCSAPLMALPSSAEILECLGKDPNSESALSRISTVLTEPVKGTFALNDTEPTLDHLIKQYSFTDKPTTDITDRLWFLFIECKTYQELSACLKELFILMKRKNTPAPFLSTSNMSRLGRALLGEGGVSIHDPIEYLVEIGIEKLKKEVLLIFSKAQIATGNNLNIPKCANFSEISSVDWLATARKWHLWLCQVHCALEILSRIQDSLFLSNAALYSIAPNILKFCTGDDSKIDSFNSITNNPLIEIESPIPIKNIEKSIANKLPKEWFFCLTSTSKMLRCKSIFYKTSKKNCFPVIAANLDVSGDMTLPHSAYLFQWFLFRSVSQLLS